MNEYKKYEDEFKLHSIKMFPKKNMEFFSIKPDQKDGEDCGVELITEPDI